MLRNRERWAQNPDEGQEEGALGSWGKHRSLILTGGWKAGLRADRAAVDEVGHYGFREDSDHRC